MRGSLRNGFFRLFYTLGLYKLGPLQKFTFPNSLCIDTSTICNLKCPCCPTGRREDKLSRGFLKFSDFKKFIDKYGFLIEEIYLSNKGEMFLNPEIFDIIKYAEDRGIYTYADTNLNYFNEKMAEKLVKSGMSWLTIAIDGASQKTYSKYRIGGDFNKVIRGVELINKFKKKYGSQTPHLEWQFIVFGHNEKEIGEAKKMADKLNMSFFVRKSFDKNFSLPSKLNEIRKKWKVYEGEKNFCEQLWTAPRINYNGNVLGCCLLYDEKYTLGNVFKEGFFKVYNGKRMKKARDIVLGKANFDKTIFCSNCEFRKKPIPTPKAKPTSPRKELIVTLADKNFIDQAKQVFSSIYWKSGWKWDYMLLAHQIPEKDLKWFIERGILVKRCEPLYDKPIGKDNYSPIVLDKFYLFREEFKRWNHVVFLDADVMVRGSLIPLTKTKKFSSPKILNNHFDSYFSFNSKEEKDSFNKRYNLKRPTFNSGMMSFETNLIEKDTFDKLLFLFHKYKEVINGDDSIFNMFFYPVWKKLPIKYNVRINNSKIEGGTILHFEQPFRKPGNNFKPWEKENPFYKEWKENLDKAEKITSIWARPKDRNFN
ncbi:Glycosyl transferase family 8 [uncultured archaeon]|nr:Glycosyl transferase family 8 [uncultured archaeon]